MLSNKSITSFSWKVGSTLNFFAFVFAIFSAIPVMCTGFLSFIRLELCFAHLANRLGLYLLQCLSPVGLIICLSLSIIDCFLVLVFIPRVMHRFLMVSFDRLFSRSISLRLFP